MDWLHASMAALLAAQGICWLVNMTFLWRLFRDLSSIAMEMRSLVAFLQAHHGR